MALVQLTSLPFRFTRVLPPERKSSVKATKSFNVQCGASNEVSTHVTQTNPRRTAGFEPSIWSYDYLQSLNSEYKGESHTEQRKVLKEEVRMMLCKETNDQVDQLELIDVLQRLGVAYHFDNEIRNILDNVYSTIGTFKNKKKDLHTTALEFRLLKQHKYKMSTDAFDNFRNEIGNFKKCESAVGVVGMLSLYEASFFSFEDETILDETRDFTIKFLKQYVSNNSDNHISLLISHALELPLHWRLPRWEHKWFIDAYERSPNMIPVLLQFAKLDFNIVQTIYHEDVKHASRWWKRTALVEKLSFARDRLVENFFFGLGMNCRPDLGYFRRCVTKVNGLITTIDDIYDLYGTIEELEQFTEVIDRWDLNAVDSLPHYMKIMFFVLNNFVNDMAYEALKENGYNITPHLHRSWAALCKSYMIEAKWNHSGYTPSLEEYIENGWISVGGVAVLICAYFSDPDSVGKEHLLNLVEYPNIIRISGTLLRLANDLGSSEREMKHGDVPKSIQCYMNESGVCEADAREHVKSVMATNWKKLNKELLSCSHFPRNFLDIAENLGKTAQSIYLFGDAYSVQDAVSKSLMLSLIIEPIPVDVLGTEKLLKK